MGRRFEQQFEQTRRHFDVVAEGLMSKVQLVAEGVVAGSERMDRFQTNLDRLEGRVSRLEVRVSALESQRP
jgi:hypothetical protein